MSELTQPGGIYKLKFQVESYYAIYNMLNAYFTAVFIAQDHISVNALNILPIPEQGHPKATHFLIIHCVTAARPIDGKSMDLVIG